MEFRWSWLEGISNYFRFLTKTIELTIPTFKKKPERRKTFSTITLAELLKTIQNDESIIYNYAKIRGVYSEFVPIINISHLFPKKLPLRPDSQYGIFSAYSPTADYALPLRLDLIEGIGISGLYNFECEGVYDNFIPVFYSKRLLSLQKDLTGKEVEISAKVVSIPSRWDKLMVPNDIFNFESDGKKYHKTIGLFVKDIKVIRDRESFLIDLWRMDNFPVDVRKSDEERYEFFQKIVDSKNWPFASRLIMNYLSYVFDDAISQNTLAVYGILPQVNAADVNKLKKARKNLKNFYLYSDRQRESSCKWIPHISWGHGIFNEENYKKAIPVFHYDQVEPLFE